MGKDLLDHSLVLFQGGVWPAWFDRAGSRQNPSGNADNRLQVTLLEQVYQLQRLCHSDHFQSSGQIFAPDVGQSLESFPSNRQVWGFLPWQT